MVFSLSCNHEICLISRKIEEILCLPERGVENFDA